MRGWISVENKLPELRTSVLCCVKNHVSEIIIVLSREQTTHDGIIEWIATFSFKPPEEYGEPFFPVIKDELVTHWMPLPEMPK